MGREYRILTPTFGNCRSVVKRYKRYRNKATKWHNTYSKGGSLPKKYILAGRRKTGSKPQAGGGSGTTSTSAERQPESCGTGEENNKASKVVPVPMGVLGQDTLTNPPAISFGGSGAKFSSLRNRRGVRAGQDGLVQKRLVLTVVNGGDGRFSLSIGGKRKIDESEGEMG